MEEAYEVKIIKNKKDVEKYAKDGGWDSAQDLVDSAGMDSISSMFGLAVVGDTSGKEIDFDKWLLSKRMSALSIVHGSGDIIDIIVWKVGKNYYTTEDEAEKLM